MKKLRVTPAAVITMAVLLSVGEAGEYWMFFVAAVCHECGHACMIRLLGNEIEQISVIPGGLDICYTEKHRSYGTDILIAAAGPAMNLLIAMAGSSWRSENMDFFIGCNVLLAFFNLIPVYPLDGGRVLYSVMTCCSPVKGAQVFFLLSATLSILLFTVACGACFYRLQALWSVLVFGYILCQQEIGLLYKETM